MNGNITLRVPKMPVDQADSAFQVSEIMFLFPEQIATFEG